MGVAVGGTETSMVIQSFHGYIRVSKIVNPNLNPLYKVGLTHPNHIDLR